MTISQQKKISFFSSLVGEIVANLAKIIGNTSYTLAGNVPGISFDKERKLKLSDSFTKENLDSLVNSFSQIIGPVAKTLAVRAAVKVVDDDKELKSELPDWFLGFSAEWGEEGKS